MCWPLCLQRAVCAHRTGLHHHCFACSRHNRRLLEKSFATLGRSLQCCHAFERPRRSECLFAFAHQGSLPQVLAPLCELPANGDRSDPPPTICVIFASSLLASLHYAFANYSWNPLHPSTVAILRHVLHYEEQYHHPMLCRILEQQCSPGDQYRKQSLKDLPRRL